MNLSDENIKIKWFDAKTQNVIVSTIRKRLVVGNAEPNLKRSNI